MLACGEKNNSLLLSTQDFSLAWSEPIQSEGKITVCKAFDDIPDAVFLAMEIKKGGTSQYKLGILRSCNGQLQPAVFQAD